MKIACPRCEQDWIKRAKVIKNGKEIFICAECEAVWFCRDSIEYATFNYFSYYMGRQDFADDWSELEVLQTYDGQEET
jgi:transposase-like protein